MEQSVAENPNIAGFRAALTNSYTETGRFDDARRLLGAEAATNFESVPRDVVWGTTMSIFGEVAATLGARDEAAIILEQLRPFTHLIAVDGAHVYAPIALAAGRLAWSLGRDEANALLDTAETIARKVDAPIWLARALAAQSELYADRSRAEQALAIVERLGDTAIGTRVRALLARP